MGGRRSIWCIVVNKQTNKNLFQEITPWIFFLKHAEILSICFSEKSNQAITISPTSSTTAADRFPAKAQNLDSSSPFHPNLLLLGQTNIFQYSPREYVWGTYVWECVSFSHSLTYAPVNICLAINANLIWPVFSISVSLWYCNPSVLPTLIQTA